jgi:phenylalanyl-tRNA synthetase beta chain
LEADAPRWAAPLWGFEVRVSDAVPERPQYRALPTTPPVSRDLALVLPAGVTAEAVTAVLQSAVGALLTGSQVFDEYRGSGLPTGSRSVAWHLTFRDPTRTLRETEADELITKALRALKEELDVRRREES